MSWLDNLQQASFRGVQFYVDETDDVFGRSVAVHSFPTSEDDPETEDLGTRPTRFSLQMYVIGTQANSYNYMASRDDLRAALLLSGPGTLVHPYMGRYDVVVEGDVRMTQSTREGGKATFVVNFVVSEQTAQPSIEDDTQQAVQDQASATQTSAVAQLSDNYSVPNASLAVDARAALTNVFGTIEGVIGNLTTTQAQIAAMESLPGQIAAQIQADIAQIESLGDLQLLFPYSYSGQPTSTLAQSNRVALSNYVQAAALIGACTVASTTAFTSSDDALSTQQIILAQLDAVQALADDDLFLALEDLRAAVVTDISTRGANLAALTTLTLPYAMPSLVVAYSLYGAVDVEDSAADIVARNSIEDPAFCPAQLPLEVLTAWTPAP